MSLFNALIALPDTCVIGAGPVTVAVVAWQRLVAAVGGIETRSQLDTIAGWRTRRLAITTAADAGLTFRAGNSAELKTAIAFARQAFACVPPVQPQALGLTLVINCLRPVVGYNANGVPNCGAVVTGLKRVLNPAMSLFTDSRLIAAHINRQAVHILCHTLPLHVIIESSGEFGVERRLATAVFAPAAV
jgi:hypothetical protein